jgi:large subunit ribosomal protein L15
MPLIRRVPKRGFTNPFRVPNQVVNLRDLHKVSGEVVTPTVLREAGLLSTVKRPVKILGTGEVTRVFVIKGCLISGTARSKIEQAGGRVEA